MIFQMCHLPWPGQLQIWLNAHLYMIDFAYSSIHYYNGKHENTIAQTLATYRPEETAKI